MQLVHGSTHQTDNQRSIHTLYLSIKDMVKDTRLGAVPPGMTGLVVVAAAQHLENRQ